MKSTKPILLRLLTLMVISPLIFLLSCQESINNHNSPHSEQTSPTRNAQLEAKSYDGSSSEEKERGHSPDAMREFFALKAGEDGKVPFGLRRQWREHDRMMQSVQQGARLADPFSEVKELGPSSVGGRTRAILFTESGEKFWAGAVSGGLWVSPNYGSSWNAIDDQADNLSVTCIDASPFNENFIYYGTGEPRGTATSIDGDGDGVYKSTDGGASWAPCGLPSNPNDFSKIWDIKCSPANPGSVYAATTAGLFKSIDGGVSWNNVLLGSMTDIILFATGEVMVAQQGVGIQISPNGNSGTFNLTMPTPLPSSDFDRFAIESSQAAPNTVYALFASVAKDSASGFFMSPDKGVSWTELTTPNLGRIQSNYNILLGIRDSDENQIVTGMQLGNISYDGGVTWQSMPLGHSDFHSFADHPNGQGFFYVGTDGGVYEYEWLTGGNPLARNTGYAVTQFHGGDHTKTGDRVLGTTQDNGNLKVYPNGFVKLDGPEAAGAFVHDQNPNIAYYFDFTDSTLVKYTDFTSIAPVNFSQINNDPLMMDDGYNRFVYFSVNENDGDQIYMQTKINLWRSIDQGATWDSLHTTAVNNIERIGLANENDPTLFYGSSGVFSRIDNAKTATTDQDIDLSTGLPFGNFGCIKVNPSDKDLVYISFMNFSFSSRIYLVENAMSATPTYTSIQGNLPVGLPVNWIECDPDDPDNIIFAGTDFGLYYTLDGGINWKKEERIPNVYILQMSFRKSDRTLFLYTHGRGIWKLRLRSDINLPALSGFPEVEDFENNMVGWNQDYSDDIDWERWSSSPSPSGWITGLTGGFSGTNYLVLAGTTPVGGKGKIGKVLSPEYDISSLVNPELTFYYWMNGANMGSLKLAISSDQGLTWDYNVWSLSGNQGLGWKMATVDLSPYLAANGGTGSVLFRWRGITGTGNDPGDIGLDLVTVQEDPSPRITATPSPSLEGQEISVFPSRFSDRLTIRLPEVKGKPFAIQVYSTRGKILFQRQGIKGEIVIDGTGFAKGVYWLVVSNDEEKKAFTVVRE